MNLLCFISPDGEECSVEPIACSKDKSKIEDYKNSLLSESEKYDAELQKYEEECKRIIRTYLLANDEAIAGWNHEQSPEKQAFVPPSNEEKDKIIEFLCESYRFLLGKNIVVEPYQKSLLQAYCDIEKFRKPYPTLPQCPPFPVPYYQRKFLEIIEVKDLDEE